MRLLAIEIQNYRCFTDFSLELGGDSILVIGSNAGGKTSLLAAIRAALQGRRMPAFTDLADPAVPLEIIATLADIPPAAHGAFADAMTFTNPPQLRIGVRATWDEHEHELETVHGFPDNGWRRASREAREQIPSWFLPSWRDPSRLLSFTGSGSLLDELLRTLDLETVLETALAAVSAAGEGLSNAGELQGILADLREELGAVIPDVGGDAYEVGLGVLNARDLLRQFELLVSYEGPPRAASEQSGGISQLAVFGVALRLLSAYPAAIVLVDEPELALHPHAQRALVRRLRERAGQSVIATHSANILSGVDPRGITRLRRVARNTEAVRTAPISDAEARRLTRYATAQTAEAYFARTVVLFEGVSDLLAFRTFAERAQVPLDARGVTLLSLDGADLFRTYLSLLGPVGLELRIVGLCDADREGSWSSELNRVGITVTDRASLSAAGIEVCDPDLEAELVASLTSTEIEQVFDADGALSAFRSFAQQPANATLSADEKQLRFIQESKVRWAPLLAAAVDVHSIPPPIDRTIGRL